MKVFWWCSQRQTCGRGAARKVAVFGILKRGGKVYTKVVGDTKSETLMPLIPRKTASDSMVYTDCYRSYNNALDVSHFYHERINLSTLFANGKNFRGDYNGCQEMK